MTPSRTTTTTLLLAVMAGLGCSSSSPGPAAGTGDGGLPPGVDATSDSHSVPPEAGDALVHKDAAPPDAGDALVREDAAPDAPISLDAPDDAGHDAGPDAASPSGIAALTACLGASVPLTISGQMPYVSVAMTAGSGTESGEFVLDYATTFSSIDLSAFAAPGPTTSGCNASELGSDCTVGGFVFFGPPSSVVLETEDFSDVSGTVRQAGIVGTDLTSEHVLTLDYAGGHAYAASPSTACSASALTAAGFASLTTAGFFENNLALLEPGTDVDSNDAEGESVPNVPTVSVSVAGTKALAQLDTGFDDSVTPFSVNVNQAFYTAIVGANASALVRAASLDESLSTCVSGVSEPVKAYTLASGVTFDFVGAGSSVARSYASAVIFVKETPAAAQECGGIGTWTVPAAQVGASFYVDMGALVFDPFGAEVWIPHT
jgi:hypothetical protein